MSRNRYYLGKCDYNGSGRRNCKAYIEWELSADGRFSMTAEIWNPRETDIYCGGQCVDTVASFFPNDAKAARMVAVWREWHLNDMRAGSPAQEAELRRHKFPGYGVSYRKWAKEILSAAGLEPDASYLHNGKPYHYGSAWLKHELPPEVRAEIESWARA